MLSKCSREPASRWRQHVARVVLLGSLLMPKTIPFNPNLTLRPYHCLWDSGSAARGPITCPHPHHFQHLRQSSQFTQYWHPYNINTYVMHINLKFQLHLFNVQVCLGKNKAATYLRGVKLSCRGRDSVERQRRFHEPCSRGAGRESDVWSRYTVCVDNTPNYTRKVTVIKTNDLFFNLARFNHISLNATWRRGR